MKDNLKHIGENIRAARKNKNLTIETLSELIGISESFLGTIERGESSLSIDTLIKICTTLAISSDSLIFINSIESNPSTADKKDTLITLLNNASDDEIDYLIDYIKFYRGRINFQDAQSKSR